MLFSTLRQSSRVLGRRYQSTNISTNNGKVSTTFLTAWEKEASFKKNWLSDPGCYPIIAIMGAAVLLVVGTISAGMAFNPDVRTKPSSRHAIIRTWGLPGYKGPSE